jgi:S1/P1 Nuclease
MSGLLPRVSQGVPASSISTVACLFRSALSLAAVCSMVLPAVPAHAWGNDGHKMINRLAAAALPQDVPAFLRSQAAIEEIEYLGPEPDRWRSRAEPELSAAQAPEHFIDLELADALGPLPRKRLDFEAMVFAAGKRPETIGLQPWQTDEVWERLKAAMREYRSISSAGGNTKPVEAAIVFYAGWLGHYVGDGSQPLHVTVQYNGWTGPNPHGYTTDHQIHSQFESAFVAANIHAPEVAAKMAPLKTIDGDMFDAYVAYLRHTGAYIEKVYQLDKAGGFTGAGTPESRDFTAERIAAGASMLRDMIYAAWVDSAQPVPDPYAGK